jgi:hypothetical protein
LHTVRYILEGDGKVGVGFSLGHGLRKVVSSSAALGTTWVFWVSGTGSDVS